jgi:RimJ/RimL family protein N-acetyltransferase
MMNQSQIETPRLTLVPQTVAGVRAMVAAMAPADRAEVSEEWLARLEEPGAEPWMLGFALVERASGAEVGSSGFKAPPADGMVELAYGVAKEFRGRGYATEAAAALVQFAADSGAVSVVRAHTLVGPNASTRVLQKCGFRLLGEVIDPEDGPVWRWERVVGSRE